MQSIPHHHLESCFEAGRPSSKPGASSAYTMGLHIANAGALPLHFRMVLEATTGSSVQGRKQGATPAVVVTLVLALLAGCLVFYFAHRFGDGAEVSGPERAFLPELP
jgi:hypothetical protein